MIQSGKGPSRNFGEKVLAPPSGMHWIWSQERIDEAMKNGRIRFTNKGTPEKIQYLDELDGDIVDDIWNDVFPINSQALEALDYPTQKPESLLERIINASSNPSDIVFDCFMGSGTTQAVAMKLGRRFIGADINLGAIQTTTNRLINIAKGTELGDERFIGFEVYNVNNYDVFRNPVEAKRILLEALEIEPLDGSSVYDGEKDGRFYKIIPADVNRIATKADLEGFISNLPYNLFEKKKSENFTEPVLKLTIVCMGHEPDLTAAIVQSLSNYKVDIQVQDVLADRKDLHFKRTSEGTLAIEDAKLMITSFYPLNLMQKLSMQRDNVEDWRQLVDSIMIDFNYDGAVLSEPLVDLPEKNKLVKGVYDIPPNSGKIKVKITDLLSESLELETEIK
jgi:site-specific DNA-methyltransferase (adenine-specific)/adenine-specific DNA-methyltransferase